MRGYLVRIGIDHSYGHWNAPIDPMTNEFVYVPIPEERNMRRELATPYRSVLPALAGFAEDHPDAAPPLVALPSELAAKNMHLDPDFEQLTYGDSGIRRGKGLIDLKRDDLVVFYAGLRPVTASTPRLIYALVGLYRVKETVLVKSVAASRWSQNAHTRCMHREPSDVIVRAQLGGSGRLRRCIPIGEYRDRAYRVESDILDRWGGLSCKNGYLQRSAVLPMFKDARRFMNWFERQSPDLVSANNL